MGKSLILLSDIDVGARTYTSEENFFLCRLIGHQGKGLCQRGYGWSSKDRSEEVQPMTIMMMDIVPIKAE